MPSTSRQNEPIAIIGSACRFAGGVNTPSNLWNLLRNPKDVRTEIPSTRFNATGYYHPNSAHHGHSNVKHSYLINHDLSAFDAEFFSINPIEACQPELRQEPGSFRAVQRVAACPIVSSHLCSIRSRQASCRLP